MALLWGRLAFKYVGDAACLQPYATISQLSRYRILPASCLHSRLKYRRGVIVLSRRLLNEASDAVFGMGIAMMS